MEAFCRSIFLFNGISILAMISVLKLVHVLYSVFSIQQTIKQYDTSPIPSLALWVHWDLAERSPLYPTFNGALTWFNRSKDGNNTPHLHIHRACCTSAFWGRKEAFLCCRKSFKTTRLRYIPFRCVCTMREFNAKPSGNRIWKKQKIIWKILSFNPSIRGASFRTNQ